jgi:hypothetical protein
MDNVAPRQNQETEVKIRWANAADQAHAHVKACGYAVREPRVFQVDQLFDCNSNRTAEDRAGDGTDGELRRAGCALRLRRTFLPPHQRPSDRSRPEGGLPGRPDFYLSDPTDLLPLQLAVVTYKGPAVDSRSNSQYKMTNTKPARKLSTRSPTRRLVSQYFRVWGTGRRFVMKNTGPYSAKAGSRELSRWMKLPSAYSWN